MVQFGDVQKLPEHVKNSQTLMLYMTKEVYERHWIVQELEAAIQNTQGLLLMRETDPRHGGMPLAAMKSQCPKHLALELFKRPVIDWWVPIHISLNASRRRLSLFLPGTETPISKLRHLSC